ncbi:MAG: DUF2804 family protein, partial [Propionicimonas sp.]|nr:DUF2804 family protein [Propionicimonas sp.]
ASWDGRILVPFSPEAELSGVGRHLAPDRLLWYRRRLRLPEGADAGRPLLHFGAVDQHCAVFLDGRPVATHEGGYLPFTVDLTGRLGDGEGELAVVVRDLSDTSYHARGKQRLRPGGIWYTAQSGIWQTVWLEVVPEQRVESLRLVPDLAAGELEVGVRGPVPGVARVEIRAGDEVVAQTGVALGGSARLAIPDARPWSPQDPFLYSVTVRLGEDAVASYAGLRSVAVAPDRSGIPRIHLNGRPVYQPGLLDQGYWPDGLYTPPSDDALVHDIATMRSLGYTMLRQHIKVAPLRWYHHCDRLGMLVWQDFVNGGRSYRPLVVTAPVLTPLRLRDSRYAAFGRQDAAGRAEFRREARETVDLLANSPAVVAWVPFNEGWGQFDAAEVAAEVARQDPSRIVDHASGWHDQGAGDLDSRHVYFRPVRLRRAVGSRAVAVSEYGGYSLAGADPGGRKEFGYRRFADPDAFLRAFERLHLAEILPAVRRGLAASVYTQVSDVEGEVNGLLTADRERLKVPVERVRALNEQLVRAGSPGEFPLPERELTGPVALCRPDGRLNPGAIGWTRQPLHDTDGIGRGRFEWGRNKRWEYWNVITPTHVLALTVSDLDYAGVHEVWVFDRATGESIGANAISPLAVNTTLPGTLGRGPVRARAGGLTIALDEVDGGTRLRAETARVRFDVLAARPPGHQAMGVVVPWDERRFQYTVKDVARPAGGELWVDGVRHPVPEGSSWAVLDHGRGRWPYQLRWNWGAASGVSDGRVVGVQVGARWTDGTGSTENALVVDGVVHKIGEDLAWDYDPSDWLRPWRIHGRRADLVFTPFHNKASVTNLGVLASRGNQCFGHYDGWMADDAGARVRIVHLAGWAEDVFNRW